MNEHEPAPPRRRDLQLPREEAQEFLIRSHTGCISTTGPDGWPYAIPMLYIATASCIRLHGVRSAGHFRSCVDAQERACFLVHEAGEVYGYGRFDCDTSISYTSVMARGRIRVQEDAQAQSDFFDALMAKYAAHIPGRPKSFYPRLGDIVVYEMSIESLAGKKIVLPASEQQWPRLDRTKSPHLQADASLSRSSRFNTLP